jgi:hypothetical protein
LRQSPPTGDARRYARQYACGKVTWFVGLHPEAADLPQVRRSG